MRLPCTLLVAALLPSLWAGQIENVTTLTARPERHGRVDFDVLLRGEWTNPYCSREVTLDLRLVAPSGRTVVVPGFPVSGAAGELAVWQVRFAPAEAGTYRGEVVLADVSGPPFRGLGENIGWESRSFDDSKYFRTLHESPRYHYEYLLGTLAAHGATSSAPGCARGTCPSSGIRSVTPPAPPPTPRRSTPPPSAAWTSSSP